MPLDPEAKAMLETMSAAPKIDYFSVPHTVIRQSMGAMPGTPQGPEMARVENRDIDGPESKIPVRIYTPPGGV
jgi:hypothetical protein